MSKIVGWGALTIIVLGGLAWYLFGPSKGLAPEAANSTMGAPAAETTLPSGSSTSDASLSTDLNAIDTQMTGFSSDSNAMNASMSDQAVSQSSI